MRYRKRTAGRPSIFNAGGGALCPRGAKRDAPKGPKAQRPKGPKAQRPKGPKAQRPKGPKAQRPKGPKAQRPKGPAGSAGSQCLRPHGDARPPHEQGAGALRFGSDGAAVGADGGRPTSRGLPPAVRWATLPCPAGQGTLQVCVFDAVCPAGKGATERRAGSWRVAGKKSRVSERFAHQGTFPARRGTGKTDFSPQGAEFFPRAVPPPTLSQ